MSFDLLHRWLRRSPPRTEPVRPLPARLPSATAEAPALAGVGLGARRPLLAPGGQLAGFEFHALPPRGQRARSAADEAALTRAAAGNLLGAMRLCTASGLQAVAEMPLTWLQTLLDKPDGDAAFTPGMVLLLPPTAPMQPASDASCLAALPGQIDLAARLRAQGVRLGWNADGGAAPLPGPPDVLRLRPAATPEGAPLPMNTQAWQRVLSDSAAAWPGVPLLLLDLDDINQLEALLAAPVLLAACAVAAAPADGQAAATALPPQTQRLLGLMNRLVRGDDNTLLVADIKADAALSLRLLRLMNSAGASPGRVLGSIDEVVQLLGRDALYRWVAQLLVQQAPARPAGAALQALALARARLLELLARQQGEANPGGFYLLGLTSMLPLLLRCRLDAALASLQLPPQALQALHDKGGDWQPYLLLALALERNDMVTAQRLAQPLGGLSAVLALSAKAWLPG